jgi:hypothetical protein
VGTEDAELCVDEGTLFDYILLRITEPGRQGTNIMEAGVRAVNLRHPGAEKSAYVERTINMIGRKTGQSEGSFRGYLRYAKVERMPMASTSPSLMWVARGRGSVRNRRQWGLSLGFGETDEVRLCTSWVADLRAVCARVEGRWGKKLVVYEG